MIGRFEIMYLKSFYMINSANRKRRACIKDPPLMTDLPKNKETYITSANLQ